VYVVSVFEDTRRFLFGLAYRMLAAAAPRRRLRPCW
jgi:hypothetical protein